MLRLCPAEQVPLAKAAAQNPIRIRLAEPCDPRRRPETAYGAFTSRPRFRRTHPLVQYPPVNSSDPGATAFADGSVRAWCSLDANYQTTKLSKIIASRPGSFPVPSRDAAGRQPGEPRSLRPSRSLTGKATRKIAEGAILRQPGLPPKSKKLLAAGFPALASHGRLRPASAPGDRLVSRLACRQ